MNKLVTAFLVFLALIFGVFLIGRFQAKQPVTSLISTENPKYKTITSLATEVQIDYFESKLGKPTFKNLSPDKSQVESVFIDPDYYVQAISDPNGKVLAYSVTGRNENFNPTYDNGMVQFTLGVTPLDSITPNSQDHNQPQNCYGFISGATAPSYYFEEHYFGNPGLYQTYLFGFNQTGPWNPGVYNLSTETFDSKTDCMNNNVRGTSIFNTYTILSPQTSFKAITEEFQYGVDYTQTRLIPEGN